MPVMDQEIEAQVKPGKAKTRSVPFAVGAPRFGGLAGLNLDSFGPEQGKDRRQSDLSFRVLDRLRNTPTMVTALTLIRAPIMRMMRQASIVCDDPSITRVLEHALLDSGLWYDAMAQSLNGGLAFGFQVSEKCWQVEELNLTYEADDAGTGEQLQGSAWKGPALTIKELRDANPETVKAFRRRVPPPGSTATKDANGKPFDGSFDGFYWNDGTQQADVWVEPQNSFLYTHDKEFGNLWGKPRTKPAYSYSWWSDFAWKLWMAWLGKKVVPTRLVRFPEGETLLSETSDETMGNDEIAIETVDALDDVNAVAFPSTRGEGGYLWDIEEKPVTDRTQVFQQTVDALKTEQLNGVFVPPRVFSQDQIGGYSSTAAFQDVFLMTVDALLWDVVQNGNKYLTRPLAVANFGTDIPDAKVVVPGLTDEEREQLAAVVQALLVDPDFLARIDAEQVARRRGIPLKPEEPAGAQSGQVAPDAGVPGAPPVPGAPQAAVGASPEPPQALPAGQNPAATPPDAGTGPGNLVLAESSDPGGFDEQDLMLEEVIALAQGFDASRWDVRPDPHAKDGFAVYDKHPQNGETGRRLTGFAAQKVIESWKKAAATAGKKAQAEQAKAARQSAAAQRQAERESELNARRQEREAIKQQKQLEREQKAAQAESDRQTKAQQRAAQTAEREQAKAQHEQARASQQHDATILQAARTERSQIEITTARQASGTIGQTLRNRGWDQASGALSTREEGIQVAQNLARSDQNNVYTVVKAKDGYVVARKRKDRITVQQSAPNVAASDLDPELDDEQEEPDLDALFDAAAERLRPHFDPPQPDDDEDDSPPEDE